MGFHTFSIPWPKWDAAKMQEAERQLEEQAPKYGRDLAYVMGYDHCTMATVKGLSELEDKLPRDQWPPEVHSIELALLHTLQLHCGLRMIEAFAEAHRLSGLLADARVEISDLKQKITTHGESIKKLQAKIEQAIVNVEKDRE